MLHFADLRRHAFACLLALSCAAMPPSAQASPPDAPDEAAYRRSLQLREQWMYLTTGLAGPATWIDGERYRYRRTAPGGFEFVVRRLGQAQAQAAFDAVRPGVTCEAVDQAARDVLEAAGLGPDYRLPGLPHRTGHGCGLAIHEAPYLVRGNALPLAQGMCCSDEPMIVVPGRFGVRLEDHFHVTEEGARWFTPPATAIDRPFAD